MIKETSFVLASSSPARCNMLKSAGLTFTVDPADIDESTIRDALLSENDEVDPGDVALVLARAKGEHVSKRQAKKIVVAADQVLAIDGEIISKPSTLHEAKNTLLKLRGKTHTLHSATAIAIDSETKWAACDVATLKMRNFSHDFLANYVLRTGQDLLQSVGAYNIEEQGIQLFEEIEGDFFTILGLPLLPLLSELRRLGGANT